jgi:hypothetical protein
VFSAISGVAVWRLRPVAAVIVSRFVYPLPEGQQFTGQRGLTRPVLAMSPDGTQFVYVANNQLYLRSMGDLSARPIPGTETKEGILSPVFSPDGQSIAFCTAPPDVTLKRIAVSGGTAVKISKTAGANPMGINWTDGDDILFGLQGKGSCGFPPLGANLKCSYC